MTVDSNVFKYTPAGKTELQIPSIWLRDSCPCIECKNANAKQKYFDSAELDLEVHVSKSVNSKDAISIEWSDGHFSVYERTALDALIGSRRPYSNDGSGPPDRQWKVWPSALPAGQTVEAARLLADFSSLDDALDGLLNYGILVIKAGDSVVDPDELCERLAGFVDRSYFGDYFDLRVKPDEKTDSVSFSTRRLPMHTDLPYYTTPPDFQFLFGLEVNNDAGSRADTLFVDGLAASNTLRMQSPREFELLTRTPVTYRAEYPSANKVYENRTPIIHLNEHGEVDRIVNNPTKMFFDDVKFDDMAAVYAAYKKFKQLLTNSCTPYSHRWRQGDMVIFDNRRTFHGRGDFTSKEMSRTLRGGYFSEVELQARAQFASIHRHGTS